MIKINVLKLFLEIIILVGTFVHATAQNIKIHAHNDYLQTVPFYLAYAQQVASIEADVYAVEDPDTLLVAHQPLGLFTAPSLDEAYIKPLISLFKQHGGRAWRNSEKTLTLLIELKTPPTPTLDKVIALLNRHPNVFDPAVNPYAVRVVITGHTPPPETFGNYPPIVSFDGTLADYTPAQLERVTMISLNFSAYSQWNGKGSMTGREHDRVVEAIARVHALGKPIRFWGTPDGITAWNTFYTLGVDYINTDHLEACTAFFRDFHKKNYMITENGLAADDVARAKRLDKATAGFQGFRSKDLQLTEGVSVYQPTYRNDGAESTVKNIIFLIGDGMGLAQAAG